MDKMKVIEHAWSVEPESIFTFLDTAPKGLSEEEAARCLSYCGRNVFNKQEKKNALTIFLKQLARSLIFILIGAAVINENLIK